LCHGADADADGAPDGAHDADPDHVRANRARTDPTATDHLGADHHTDCNPVSN